MGWVWRDDDHGDNLDSHAVSEIKNPNNGDYCSTRRIVKSNCRTEEVESGKFVRKCEKTEEVLRDCLGNCAHLNQKVVEVQLESVVYGICDAIQISHKLKWIPNSAGFIGQSTRSSQERPTEVLQSVTEYTEEDVTGEVMRGSSIKGHSEIQPFEFPGLRNDMDTIFGSIFNTAEEMKKDLFSILDDLALFGSGLPSSSSQSSSSSRSRGIPIEEHNEKDTKGNTSGSGEFDLSGLAQDVDNKERCVV
ncbi:hypothetical protein V2J09_010145 [Rumex salicifolius]